MLEEILEQIWPQLQVRVDNSCMTTIFPPRNQFNNRAGLLGIVSDLHLISITSFYLPYDELFREMSTDPY